jgi:AraC family transcriptional regulator, regulatory protein of adaptative response / DNA-3-methyladenine glycosylase II
MDEGKQHSLVTEDGSVDGAVAASAGAAEAARERYYRAYETRDARFDGAFFVAVHSTGIFCRPICPARTPKRANVSFHPTAASAFAAGYRPCLRCHPERAPQQRLWEGGGALVARALSAIEAGALNDGSLEDLSARIGVTSRHLRRLFETHAGTTPVQVAQSQRLLLAAQLIKESNASLADIAYAAGFGSVRRFNAAWLAAWGRAPNQMRRRLNVDESPAAGTLAVRLGAWAEADAERFLAFHRTRAWRGVEMIDGNAFRRSFVEGQTHGGEAKIGQIEITREAGMAVVRLSGASVSMLPKALARARRMLDMNAPLAAIDAQLRSNKKLRPALRHGVPRVPCAWDPFELGLRAILGQQISVAAATTLAGRLTEQFGSAPSGARLAVFPSARRLAELSVDEWRAIGLTQSRAATLAGFSRAVAEDAHWVGRYSTLPEFIERLTALNGIGPWTAHYIAMRGFCDPDAFPASDLGLLRAAQALGIAQTARQLEAASAAWRPWRAYAAQALWNYNLKDSA